MEKGILPGADVEDDYNRQHESGRVHSHYGIFAPWDARTPQQAHANAGALHSIPGSHIRQGGRITDSGTILVSRPVPFKLVKEAWLLVPSSRDHRSFEHQKDFG